jgi:transposase
VYDGAIAVDESSFVSIDTPRKGWAQRNRHVPKPPPKVRKRVSLLLAIDTNGVVDFEIRDGSFNTASYSSFLRRLPRGRRITADNVAFHKSKLTRDVASERDQTLVFTPPYCPWFNPVEFAFSVTKGEYRRARSIPGSNFVNDVRQAIGTRMTGKSCSGFFRHAHRCLQVEMRRALVSCNCT